ncbi:MAG: metallophosphoesterase [Thermodesulfovibrionales bacterium]
MGARAGVPLVLFMALMVAAPALVRVLERTGFEALGRLLAVVGYAWMGLLFIFFSAAIAIDLYRALVYVAAFVLRKNLYGLLPPAGVSFYLPLALALAVSVYGYFEARDIRVERLTVRTPYIPADVGRLRIVQISDVHLGLVVRRERLGLILEKVREAQPDILVSTGDLVDGQINNLAGLAEMLAEIRPRYGKYAITGNHEFYAGLPQALEFTERAGFTVLRGEAVTGVINIAGVDDETGRYFGLYRGSTEKGILEALPRDRFTLLLKHRPNPGHDSAGLFHLQLSGHTHRGQIFPFSLVTRHYFPINSGLLELRDGSSLYVSRGSGTWGPPVRFLAPPEVTVIDLVSDKGGAE